ncbi:MAG: LamG-like jellyroll fold domain-containing protein [Akkermansia sp.]
MKRTLILSLFLLSATAISHAATLNPPSNLQNGLVIYMDFEDTTANQYDSYTGYTSGVSWGGTPTTGGGALNSSKYNNTSSHPGTGALASANIHANNFSLNFQFKGLTLSTGTGSGGYILKMKTASEKSLQFETLNNSIQLWTNTDAHYVGDVGTLTNNDTAWQSFTMTSSSDGVRLYLNGVEKAYQSKAMADELMSFFQIGCTIGGGSAAGGLKTDEFGIWNRALSADEVKFLATNTANTAMPSAIPEPTTAMLALLGLTGLMLRRRKA